MSKGASKRSWSDLKRVLRGLDMAGLTALVRDLYDASPENRRFLHARFVRSDTELEEYRSLILDAVYPNLFGRKPVRIGEAQRLIRHFEQATGDGTGTLDLMLTVVEAGTDLAADTGHGDEAYFLSLEKMLAEAVERLSAVPPGERLPYRGRVDGIVARAASIGWGYCDAVREIAAAVEGRSLR